ncbi:ABC transporter ATP-binding protein [Patescibacteria group bacterium]|nr:ABC transporter ATP-binding protein [Patescibacteria group bacterium]
MVKYKINLIEIIMIRADNISKSFKLKKKKVIRALDEVSISVPQQSIFGLLGTNGAGKTTLIKILSTLIVADKGDVRIAHINVKKNPNEVRKRIGVCFGSRMLYYRITGRNNLKFYGRMFNVPNIDKRISELASFFEMEEKMDELVEGYSLGTQSKLAIMRALIHDPEILFLDEPTIGLDPATAHKLRNKITQMRDDEGKTIILCTHYLHEAEELSDSIGIMNKGKMIMTDTPSGLKKRITSHDCVSLDIVDNRDSEIIKKRFKVIGDSRETIVMLSKEENVNVLLKYLVTNNILIKNIKHVQPDLENIFIELAKKEK